MTHTTTVPVTAEKVQAMAMVWDEDHATNVESEMRNFRETARATTFDHDDTPDMRAFVASFEA